MARKLTLEEAQERLEKHYPGTDVRVVSYAGANRPATIYLPGLGEVRCNQFGSLFRFPDPQALADAIQRKFLTDQPEPNDDDELNLLEEHSATLEKLADRALRIASIEFKHRVLMSQIDQFVSIPSEDLTQAAIENFRIKARATLDELTSFPEGRQLVLNLHE